MRDLVLIIFSAWNSAKGALPGLCKKEIHAEKDLGFTGVCFAGRDRHEVDETGHRVEALEVFHSRRNIVFDIKNDC